MSGWGAGYPGVPSDVAKKAREAKAARAADAQAPDAQGANAEATATDTGPENEERATDSPLTKPSFLTALEDRPAGAFISPLAGRPSSQGVHLSDQVGHFLESTLLVDPG